MGMTDYQKALIIQEALFRKRQREEIRDIILLLEHPPTLTLGLRGKESNIIATKAQLKSCGVKVFKIYRGGDVTYHGPGQLVGYPILNLIQHGKDIRQFIWNIEEIFIRLLDEEYGLEAGRMDKYTGVWVGNEKITAIGCSIRRWVTMHGFAFNVNTNLDHFKWINPCGLTDKTVTSLQQRIGRPLDMECVYAQVVTYFTRQFKMQAEIINQAALTELTESEKNESEETGVAESQIAG
ncbi:MAG: lipoyl(octanoyl) transferase [Deltaproteobacteria bacterium RBG_13_49_15]|nr:MAG: lipoyl(octanoyl) transferase [Deltaproteobacteria bacterium RBG_13_49_15]